MNDMAATGNLKKNDIVRIFYFSLIDLYIHTSAYLEFVFRLKSMESSAEYDQKKAPICRPDDHFKDVCLHKNKATFRITLPLIEAE